MFNGLMTMVADGFNTSFEWFGKLADLIFYGIVNLLLSTASEFLFWLFAEKLAWLPDWVPPDFLVQWAEIANNVLPLDDWLSMLLAYLAFERALFVYNWTAGWFWGAV